MLPRNYRVTAFNAAGATATVTVKARRWKINSSGVLEYEASEATLLSGVSVSNAAYSSSTGQDNSSALYFGMSLTFTVAIPSGTLAGNVTLFFERSTDGGTTWDDNGRGQVIGTLAFTATGTQIRTLAFP
jgi:hypothetical protein